MKWRQTTSPPNPRTARCNLLCGERRMRLAPASPRLPYSWQTAYHCFRAWRIAGTWERNHSTLRERTRLREGRRVSPSAAIWIASRLEPQKKGGERIRRSQEGKRPQTAPFGGYGRAGDGTKAPAGDRHLQRLLHHLVGLGSSSDGRTADQHRAAPGQAGEG